MTLSRIRGFNKQSKFFYDILSSCIPHQSLQFFRNTRLYSTQHEMVVSFYDDKVTKYAEKSIRPVTLKELIRFGQPPLRTSKLLESANYTRSELPVRLARRVKALQNLPFIVGTNPYIKSIYKLYFDSFELIRSFPERIENEETDEKFAEMLRKMVSSHTENIPTLAKGFQECKKYMPSEDIKNFLDVMIHARIGTRLIAEQHIALHNLNDSSYIGIIDTKLEPRQLIQSCSNFVKELCEIHYGSTPDILVNGQIDTTFTYVPVHLEYIISEILKNSCRATVEYTQKIGRLELPQIIVTISKGKNFIGIRVRDQGGGVPAKELPSIFDYSYTTVPQDGGSLSLGSNNKENIFADVSKMAMQSGLGGPIAGLGYGLPLARIYANYFGGSMDLMSLHGYGCDVFLKLKQIDESLDDLQI
ncbi:20630_t:CDS:2 [Funneliformis geosporum]|uniref:Protein-serine/threonine kinase n=1 Tax=Funneliformis geosporum TaxID=1117311 RepID=A0A9W4T1Y2_9GLOM|nr:9105_t:CDS:2 [Funneliformis geosporum]CAI2189012.1 20630_t:CDS:2 [Funneliformis geosporum]